jgi:putative nucleotidyltransferase with HDIG domain
VTRRVHGSRGIVHPCFKAGQATIHVVWNSGAERNQCWHQEQPVTVLWRKDWAITMRDIRVEIENINDIVALPTVVTEIMNELGKEDSTIRTVTGLIESDPALTANILRAVNSPFYGLRWRVNNVSNAIGLLGLGETSKLLLAFFMKQKLFTLTSTQRDYLEQLWNHSINTAYIARLIVQEYNIPTSGKEFTASLLHDMGKIVLVEYFPTELPMTRRMVKELDQSDVQAESQILAIAHTEIGGLLAEKWKLPLDYVEVMRQHHNVELAVLNPELTSLVRFADLLAELWGQGIDEQATSTLFDEDQSFALLSKHEPRLKAQTMQEVIDNLSQKYVAQKGFVGLF